MSRAKFKISDRFEDYFDLPSKPLIHQEFNAAGFDDASDKRSGKEWFWQKIHRGNSKDGSQVQEHNDIGRYCYVAWKIIHLTLDRHTLLLLTSGLYIFGLSNCIVPFGPVEIVTEKDNDGNAILKDGKLILRLSETETMWMLSITSNYSGHDSEDVKRAKEDNETYAKLTTGKALERKRSAAETQTPKSIEKSKGTSTMEVVKVDSFVNASAWDLYDTYAELVGDELEAEKDFQKLIDTVLKGKGVSLSPAMIQNKMSHEEQIQKLFMEDGFKYSLLTAERLLASNCYQSKQSVFKKSLKSKYDNTGATTYKYEAQELWTYKQEFKENNSLSVTALDWNPLNMDLLAVGYGSLQTMSQDFGKVCIWSPKNPLHPEREFTLDHCVTAVSYSNLRPNILAFGCRNGDVFIADISTDLGCVRVLGRDKIRSRHGPVWKLQWFINKRLFEEAEELLGIGEGGILIRFSFPDANGTSSLLDLNYMSAVKVSYTRNNKALAKEIREINKITKTFVRHSISGLWFSTTTDGSQCYISTKEGVVVKATLINNCKVENIFSAHMGPIYSIEHSPFTDLIYLTCGGDWCIRIWMEGITAPLFVLKMHNPVTSAKWSPDISTLIGAVSGTDFAIWDIGKNVFLPANVIHFNGPNFSKLIFAKKGSNVVLGDERGLLRVLHLHQLPRQPFLQKEALVSAIEKGLFNNEALLKKFKRFAARNKEALKTKIVV